MRSLDPFGRHFVFRPVLTLTLFSRLIKFFAKLRQNFLELKNVEKGVLGSEENRKELASRFTALTRDCLELFEAIRDDINTLLYRDEKHLKSYYEEILEQLEHVQKEELKKISKEERKLMKKYREGLERESRSLSGKDSLGEEVKKAQAAAELDQKVTEDYAELKKALESIIKEANLHAKHLFRTTANPFEAAKELDLRGSNRISLLLKREAIKEAALYKKERDLWRRIKKELWKGFEGLRELEKELSEDVKKEERELKRIDTKTWVLGERLEKMVEEVSKHLSDDEMGSQLESLGKEVERRFRKIFRQQEKLTHAA